MSDHYAVEQSLQDQDQDYIFQNRQFTYINDSNSGSYQNQIVIDAESIANSSKYFNTQESFITVPLVMTMAVSGTGKLGTTTNENAFAASLKKSFTNLISSLSVEITNNSVVSTTNFTNLALNFNLLTSMSLDDQLNLGPTINFSKDDALGVIYNGASNAQGLGECNNTIAPSVFNPTTRYAKTQFAQNKGRLERMVSTSYDPATTGESASNLNIAGKNYCFKDPNGLYVNWYVLANLQLPMLTDLFRKLPLVKGCYMKIILNLNTNCSSQMTIASSQYTSVSTSSQNGVVPYQISPLGAGAGLDFGTATALELSIGIAKNSINKTGTSSAHPSMQSCRFNACMEDFTPAAEQMYLAKCPTKTIKYDDFLSFQSLNIQPGGNLSQILTNAISRVRKIVGIPSIASSYNFAGTAGTISPLASPFSSSPGTTARNTISNLNVLLSGTNLYQSNYLYGFEEFIQEVRKTNSINGGNSLGLSSGLISQTDFERGYRFIVADLSRTSSEATDNVARSIQVILTNNGLVPLDITWFVFIEREIQIDIQTGSLIQ